MATRANTALGDRVEKGRRISRVVVHAHSLCTQRIDQNEEDVRIASVGEVADVVDASKGAVIQISGVFGGFSRKANLNESR